MKKFLTSICMLLVIPFSFAETNFGAKGASTINLTDAPDVRKKTKITYKKYETRTSGISDSGSNVRTDNYSNERFDSGEANLYKKYDDSRSYMERSRMYSDKDSSRKYYLSHPFFQPLKGQVGSVTDVSFSQNSYSFDMVNGLGVLANEKADWKSDHFGVKEDLSFGLSDSFSLLGMIKYNYSNYNLNWKLDGSVDKESNSGINLFGIGGQWRFIDNSEWIGTIAGYYQRQKDMFDSFTADLKIGSKLKTSTFYALARGSFLNFEKDSYGDGIYDSKSDQLFFLAYKTGSKNVSFLEAGLGLFSVLDESLTLNLEGVFGNYDWHNQANVKASLGWQSSKSFSLNFYGITSVYDSANGMDLETYGYRAGMFLGNQGKAKLKDYREFSVGAQFIFLF